MAIYKKNINNLFYIFITSHVLIWTLIPTFTNHNLPLDTIEALAWGSNLDWGFNKHPPMSAFLPEIFYQIFGSQDWAYYLLSQICIVVSFIVVFKLAEDFFDNKIYCLLSVLLLEEIDNVDKKHKERKKIYKTYRKMLFDENAISLPPDYDPKKINHAHHLCPIYVDAGIRDKVIYELIKVIDS